jgi:hypothetical protein
MEPIALSGAPQDAWFYHVRGMPEAVQMFPEFCVVKLPSGTDFCITHRPTGQCPCGLYLLHWLTEEDAA